MDSITTQQWKLAQNTVLQCKKKEVTILKLYFSCMENANEFEIGNEQVFLGNVQQYMKSEKLPEAFDPSLFDLSPSNCDRVRSLLLQLQSN